jgi:two-component system, response regulator
MKAQHFISLFPIPMESSNVVEILLVEDNPDDAGLTIRALKKHNLANNLLHLHDGEEALNFLFSEKTNGIPKVILLDLKMPKVDGIEVLKKIKSDERKKIIPVVVLTSSKEERDIVESYKLGVNAYIVKPVDFDKFVKAIAEIGFFWLLLNQPPK